MSDCHATTGCAGSPQRTHPCPVNGRVCKEVATATVLHHLARPWEWDDRGRSYFFCDDPDCAVVYFSDDGQVIGKSSLRTEIGQKSHSPEALVCYCFGVSQADAQQNPAVRDFVIEQTRLGRCACESRNPSGRCCLKDFPRGGG